MGLCAFGSPLLVKMGIQIVSLVNFAKLGLAKMLNLLIILIPYADSLKVNVQSIILIMDALRDWKLALLIKLKINV